MRVHPFYRNILNENDVKQHKQTPLHTLFIKITTHKIIS